MEDFEMTQWVFCIKNILYHTVRNDNGTDTAPWQNFWGDVMGQVGPAPGPIVDVDCDVDTKGNLQLIIRANNKIWHTVRNANGSWQNFWGDVYGQSRTPPQPIKLMTCAAGHDDTFQIMLLLADEKTVLHTVRNPNGTWQNAWGNVNGQVGVLPAPPIPQFLAGG
jgi:hypothetical protein